MLRKVAGLLCSVVLLASANTAHAIIIDFENTPNLPTGPSLFADAGSAQTISAGPVSLSGGVVLGFPTNFPAITFATAPNVYGTAYAPSQGFTGDGSLLSSLSINIDPSFGASTVEGLLFNGLLQPESYSVTAFSGPTTVDSVTFNSVPANLNSGNRVFRLSSNGSAISRVEIASLLTASPGSEWDFAIDSVAVNEPIENVVPLPAALPLFGTALLGVGFFGWRKRSHAGGEYQPA